MDDFSNFTRSNEYMMMLRFLFGFLFLTSSIQAQMYTATYNSGDISGPNNYTTVTPTTCPGTLVVNGIPNGNIIDSVIMTYDFFTTLAGFQSVVNQRSYVASPTFSTAETQFTLPVVAGFATVVSYNRRVTIADGRVVNGPVSFTMYAGSADALAFASCGNAQNVVMNGTWVVNVYTSSGSATCETSTALRLSGLGHDFAHLIWTQADTVINNWELMYGVNGSSTSTFITLPLTDTTANLIGLQEVTDYRAAVRAICGTGDTSLWSAPVFFTTDTMPCELPDSTWWFKRGNSTAVIYWTPLPTSTRVELEYGPQGFTLGSGTNRPNIADDSVRISGLQAIDYAYYLRVVCPMNTSAWAGPFSFSMSTVSIAPITKALVRFYPQPVRTQLTLELDVASRFQLRDVSGRLLKQGDLNSGSQQIAFDGLAAGMYWLDIQSAAGVERLKLLYQP